MKKGIAKKVLSLAAAAAMALSVTAVPSFAYINRGDVQISGEDAYTLNVGDTVSLSVTPYEEQHYPGCQMPECPEICGAKNCIAYPVSSNVPECVCNGTEFETYYAEVTPLSSDESVATAEYDGNGSVEITANAPGEAVISITATFREYNDAVRDVTVTVADDSSVEPGGEEPEEPDEDVSQGGSSGGGGGGGGSAATAEYTVTFDSDGGSSVDSQTVKSGQKAICPDDPEKEGYEFGGWYTDEELTEEYDFDAVVRKSVTLYAKWTEVAEEPEDPADPQDPDTSDVPENPDPQPTVSFEDVSDDSWYAEYVGALAAEGIVNGKTQTEFAPDDAITRAEFVKIIAGIAGADVSAAAGGSFSDVASGSWYAPYVAWAAENGIVTGSGGKFSPNSQITRQDMAVMIMRYVNQVSGGELDLVNEPAAFADEEQISSYAAEAVSVMQQAGIISGRGGNNFAPKDSATRAEACKMLYMVMEQIG